MIDDADPWAGAVSPPRSLTSSPIKSAPSSPTKSATTRSPVAKSSKASPFAAFGDDDDDAGDMGVPSSPRRSSSSLRSPVHSPTRSPARSMSPEKALSSSPTSARSISPSRAFSSPPPKPASPPAPAAATPPLSPSKTYPKASPPTDPVSASASPVSPVSPPKAATSTSPVLASPTIAPPAPPAAAGTGAWGDDAFDDDGFNDVPLEGAAADDGFNDGAFEGGDGDDGFGDFDDFDAPTATFDDDGFGDFDEFEKAPAPAPAPAPVVQPQAPVVDWTALSLRPVPPHGELLSRIAAVLEPLVPSEEQFTEEAPRAVGGLAQVLATSSTRDTYAQLTTAPILKPLDWTRSRVRREHLISMGVPVNLDEVDSHRLSTLPPLQITTNFPRSQSVDPDRLQRGGPPSAGPPAVDKGPASAGPAMGGAESERKYGLGERPPLNTARAEELCGLDEDQLTLLPLAKLEALHADLAQQTADASALLAWLVQLKDAQTQDSATYNGMISELIANAAKVKGGSTGGGLFRRNSSKPAATKSRPSSVSASTTPRRVGSPGVF